MIRANSASKASESVEQSKLTNKLCLLLLIFKGWLIKWSLINLHLRVWSLLVTKCAVLYISSKYRETRWTDGIRRELFVYIFLRVWCSSPPITIQSFTQMTDLLVCLIKIRAVDSTMDDESICRAKRQNFRWK